MFSQNKLWSFYDNECDYEFNLKINKNSDMKSELPSYSERNFAIYFLIEGNELIEYNDDSYHIFSGDILMIKPETVIDKQYLSDEVSTIELKFSLGDHSGVLEKMILDTLNRLQFPISIMRVKPNHFISLIKKMETFMALSQENKEIYSLQLFIDIVLNLCHPDIENSYVNELDDKLSLMEKTVQDVMAHIHYNFNKKITTETLAKEFETSRPYLCRKFKELCGKTIGEYLTEVRMEYAQELLTKSHEKIISIAFLVGYDSVSQFNKIFKKNYKMTPSHYRETKKDQHLFVPFS